MGWNRVRRSPAVISLAAPRLDGSTWPALAPGARSGFGASTIHRLGLEEAFTPRAREIADVVTSRLVPLLPYETRAEDLPHLVDLLRSAARVGAGIGLVELRDSTLPADVVGRDAAGALGEAERDLPPLPAPLGGLTRYVMHAGHHLARRGTDAVDLLAADLADGH